MQAEKALSRLGGVARAHELLRYTSRSQITRAVRRGEISRLSRGRFALCDDDARRVASQVGGVLCLRSAAAHHGWAVKSRPDRPDVAVRRGRRLDGGLAARITPHWFNLAGDDWEGLATTPLRTVLDCARQLPFDEALTIADSALRSGLVTREELDAARVVGAGAAAVRRVLELADARSANAFESVLRALCLEAGLDVVPQAGIDLGTGVIHPDLVDVGRRIVLEADSWAHHASRRDHRRDCARYNLLVVRGWRVLRFSWEQVMTQPAYVRWMLQQVLGCVERPQVTTELPRSA